MGLVFAARQPSGHVAGLPELVIEGLRAEDARVLLDSVLTGPLDARVRDRIVAETRGNPLALLELPAGLTPAELAGGFGFPDAAPIWGRIEESFGRRVRALPDQSRLLLLVAAADPAGDPGLVWRAAGVLGIGAEAAAPATAAGLAEFGAWVAFRHPLVRMTVYRSASPVQRRAVHRALAEVTDPRADPDRRAWHRAQAAAGPDEDVAGELERSAGRAQARGGLAAAASFLERAALLTPEPGRRVQRLLAAARAKYAAGALDAALGLLVAVEAGPPDPLRAAEVEHLRGQIAGQQRRSGDGARLLLDALALRLTEGYAAAAPAMARAVELVLALDAAPDLEADRGLWLASPHIVGPDIGTAASLFAAAAHPGRLRSLVVGSGAAAVPLQLGSRLNDWVQAPGLDRFRRADPRQIVSGALSGIERYSLPDAVREDYLRAYEGDRMAESMRYVRAYPAELPALRDLLPQIQTAVQIIAGARDPAVPPVNAEFLHHRLPRSKLDILDAGHFTWEDAADQYAALVTTWWTGGYRAASS